MSTWKLFAGSIVAALIVILPLRAGYATQAIVHGGGYVLAGIPEQPYQGVYDDGWNQGGTAASARGSVDAGGVVRSDAFAGVDLGLFNPGIHLSAHSFHTPLGRGGNSEADAAAEWLDVIHVGGTVPPPSSLRVTFHISGVIDLVTQSYSSARVGIVNLNGFDGLVSIPPYAAGYFYQYGPVEDLFVLNSGPAHLHATVSKTAAFDLPYRDDLGGYQFNVYAAANTLTYASEALADFSNTFQLTSQ